MKDELRKYIKENLVVEKKLFSGSFRKERVFNNSAMLDECDSSYVPTLGSMSIDQFIKDNKDLNDFQTLLFKYIDDKGLIDSDVYNKVHIDRRLFSKIRSDNNYHPSKETVILLGLALELNENEIEHLLESASYSLPKNNYFDLIIRFCFVNKIYDLLTVNDLLNDYNCKLFNY